MKTSAEPIDPLLAKKIAKAYAAADGNAYFGPSFFVSHLGALVRANCPTAEERVGIVEVHLVGGDVLEVCHIVSLSPQWVALAVFDDRRDASAGDQMRTELIAYPCIARVTIRSVPRSSGRIGFGQDAPPQVSVQPFIPAEQLLARAAGVVGVNAAIDPDQDSPAAGVLLSQGPTDGRPRDST